MATDIDKMMVGLVEDKESHAWDVIPVCDDAKAHFAVYGAPMSLSLAFPFEKAKEIVESRHSGMVAFRVIPTETILG